MKNGISNKQSLQASRSKPFQPELLPELLPQDSNKPAFLEPPKQDPYQGRRRHREWFDRLIEVSESFPDAITATSPKAALQFVVDQIFSAGEFLGFVYEKDQTFATFVRVDGTHPKAGCTCDVSSGRFPCVHLFDFTNYLLDELEQPNTWLTHTVTKGAFDPGRANYERFQVDRKQQTLRQLDKLLNRESEWSHEKEAFSDAALPPLAVEHTQRLVWDFKFSDGELEVHPLLQQQKKRHDGYTKGRRVSLDRLAHQVELPLSDADRRVAGCIKHAHNPHYGIFTPFLSPLDALSNLVNHPHVQFEGTACKIVRSPLQLTLLRSGELDQWSFVSTDEQGQPEDGTLINTSTAFLRIDQANHVLYLSEMSTENVSLIKELRALGEMEANQIESITEKVRPLQHRISLRLPEAYAGPVVSEEARLALLLRSRRDGALDYGIRFRDAAGHLRRPGAEPMVVSVERDGKTIQIQRHSTDEFRRAHDLVDSLALPIDNHTWLGTISEFHTGLHVIEQLQACELDIEILWDKTSEKPITVLGSLNNANVRVDITSKRNWFGITGECDFGNTKMPLKELLDDLSRSSDDAIQGDFVRIGDGGWARISASLRQRLRSLQEATHTDRQTLKLDATAAPAIRELLEADIQVNATKAWQQCLTRLDRAETLNPTVPKNLDATLRDYQIDGYKWMSRLAEWGVGGILADDMGLGKTLQTLAVLLDRSAVGPALVIAPTSVGFNWAREAERFAPDLNVHLYRETERQEFLPSVGPGSLVVCSYGLTLRDADALAQVQWGTLVLDEAQAIKNSRSKTSKAIAALKSDWIVALTGTPVENHLGELWSLFHVVSPGVFGGWDHFRTRFALPIEKHGDEESRMALANRLKPFVLRRTKAEVLTELPPRTEMNLYVDLSPAERAEYEKVRLEALGEIDQLESLPDNNDPRFKILAMLTRLRQISCHVGLVNEKWSKSSAKLDQLCETLESLREEGHRALVFSQFTAHLALIRAALDARGISYEYLDGSTPAKTRQQAVDRFQEGTADAFLISLKAGGTGLNLTAADYVIHMDPWWNPAVEDQATDRAHRYGQDKPVMVYRIVAKGTIEEEILALHESKRDLVAGVMQGTEAAAKLSNDDLIRMLRQ